MATAWLQRGRLFPYLYIVGAIGSLKKIRAKDIRDQLDAHQEHGDPHSEHSQANGSKHDGYESLTNAARGGKR